MSEFKIGQKVWYRREFQSTWRRAKVIMIEPLLVRDTWSRRVSSPPVSTPPQRTRIAPR